MFKKICLGSVQFGLNYGIVKKKKTTYNEIKKILSLAYHNKITFIDTATSYGNSIAKISKYLIENPDQKWKIVTKIRGDKKLIEEYYSAKKFFGKNLYCILAHSSKLFFSKNFQDEISDLRRKKIKIKIGLSVYEKNEIEKSLKCRNKPSLIQLPINILDTRLYKSKILTKLKSLKIKIHARSVFLQGLFFLKKDLIREKFPKSCNYIEEIKYILKKNGFNLASFSLNWVYHLKEIDKVVIGLNNAKQLKQNLEYLNNKIDKQLTNKILKKNFVDKKILNPQSWEKK